LSSRFLRQHIILDSQASIPRMTQNPHFDKIRRRRMRLAERKLREAQSRMARTERAIQYWTRIVADLKYERVLAVQPPLWPIEDTKDEK